MSRRRKPNSRRPSQRAALAADDLLTQIDPAALASLRRFLASLDPTFTAAMGSTAAQSARLCEAMAAHDDGGLYGEVAYNGVPAWLRLGFQATLAAWAAGEATTCRHNPRLGRPEVVFAAAWKPDLVVCTRCVDLLALPTDAVANHTCDGCGHVCDVDSGDLIQGAQITLGGLLYQYGTCDACTTLVPGSTA